MCVFSLSLSPPLCQHWIIMLTFDNYWYTQICEDIFDCKWQTLILNKLKSKKMHSFCCLFATENICSVVVIRVPCVVWLLRFTVFILCEALLDHQPLLRTPKNFKKRILWRSLWPRMFHSRISQLWPKWRSLWEHTGTCSYHWVPGKNS